MLRSPQVLVVVGSPPTDRSLVGWPCPWWQRHRSQLQVHDVARSLIEVLKHQVMEVPPLICLMVKNTNCLVIHQTLSKVLCDGAELPSHY